MNASTADAARWQQIKPLLAQVLERPAVERSRVAERLSGSDAALRAELISLLAAAQADDDALRALPGGFALRAMRAHLAAPKLAGKRVGPWRIASLIARGGQGEVYRAERADGQFEQQVAIKLLRSGFDSGWVASRFAAERQLLAGLDHPNLARVLDGGTTDDGVPYFVMELVEGEPIDACCARLSLPLADRLALFRTVCQVVGYAHSKGIVHRDLKCDNVLVTAQGMVKLVDFGIAKQLNAPSQTTATARRMMTLASSSPEQVRGDQITPASDVYSLGVMLYRLLTQTSPYGNISGDSGYELTRAICDTEPAPPSCVQTATGQALTRAHRRRLRGDLDAVVLMALRKDPVKRYADAAALGEDIFRHQQSLPVRARRGALGYKLNRFVLRHRAMMGVAMIASLALIAGLGLAVFQGVEARRQKERDEKHLAAVSEFANVLIFDVHETLARWPLAPKARKIAIDKARAYIESIGADLEGNPRLMLEVASAHRRLADVQAKQVGAKPGDQAGAVQGYQRARALLEQPAADSIDDKPRAARELRETLRPLGHLLAIGGEREEGQATLQRAILLTQRAAEASPRDLGLSIELASTYALLAETLRMAPDLPAQPALDMLDQAQAVLTQTLAQDGDNMDALTQMAMVITRRDALYKERHEQTQAQRHFDHARPDFERLVSVTQPNNPEAAANLAKINATLGSFLGETEAPTLTVAGLQEAVRALERLTAAQPSDVGARFSLVTSRAFLGSALSRNGDHAQGVAQLTQAIEERVALHKVAVPNAYEQRNMALEYQQLGYVVRASAHQQARPRGDARNVVLGSSQRWCDAFIRALRQADALALIHPAWSAELKVQLRGDMTDCRRY